MLPGSEDLAGTLWLAGNTTTSDLQPCKNYELNQKNIHGQKLLILTFMAIEHFGEYLKEEYSEKNEWLLNMIVWKGKKSEQSKKKNRPYNQPHHFIHNRLLTTSSLSTK